MKRFFLVTVSLILALGVGNSGGHLADAEGSNHSLRETIQICGGLHKSIRHTRAQGEEYVAIFNNPFYVRLFAYLG